MSHSDLLHESLTHDRRQLQTGKVVGEEGYTGMVDCFRKIIAKEGYASPSVDWYRTYGNTC